MKLKTLRKLFSCLMVPSSSDCPYFVSSLPDPSCIGRNTSAIFGAGPSFGLTPAETRPQFRPAPIKKASEPRKIRRSHSDVGLRKRPNLRRKSGDFSQLRKHSESEHVNGVVCNGDTKLSSPLSLGSKEGDSVDKAGDIVGSLPDTSLESDDPSNRYPLFISVSNSAQVQSKARIVKPVSRVPNQGGAKQDITQNKQSVRPRRSASFTAPRKISESRPLVSTSSRPLQDTARNGNLRREKSDVARPHRAQSPAHVSAIPRPSRSNSSSSLKQDNNTLSPRSQSPAGIQCEASDVIKRRASPGLRREKSDLARPRAHSRTNSPLVSNQETEGQISRSSSNRSLTSTSLCKSPSKSSIEGSRSRSGSSSEMSKIPSLARSPSGADSHASRIPSLPRQNGTEERTPPKSKIPSIHRGDKGHEGVKKSQIPGRKDSASQKDKPASKILGSSSMSQNRPDSAKENKDPSVRTNGHEPAKQLSKIPSFGKSGIPKSKIPSAARKDSQNEEPPILNGTAEVPSPGSDSTKSRIPGAAVTQQGTGIPMGISRIPSFTKPPKQDEPVSNQSRIPAHPTTPSNKASDSKVPTPGVSKDTEPDGPVVNQSRIPTTPSASSSKTIESKLPTPGGSKTAARIPPSSLPVVSKISGIPKPGETAHGSRIPGSAAEKSTRKVSNSETAQTAIPVAPSTETKDKIPKLATTSKATGNEEAGIKSKRSIPTLGGRQRSMEKESSSPVEPATPPSTPIRNDAAESPLDKYIFSEAKKMEQLLRDEPIEVEVVDRGGEEEDEEFLRQEREIKELEEKEHNKGLAMLDSKEAEDLISEVLKSYAPDINSENQPEMEDVKLYTEKDDNKNIKDNVNVDDIVLQPIKRENQAFEKSQVLEQSYPKLDFEGQETADSVKEDSVDTKKKVVEDTFKLTEKTKEKPKTLGGKVASPDLKIEIPKDKAGEVESEETRNKEEMRNEGPGIDTLGEYAQHARRSRSRQRKIVSPDSEEPEKEFVAEPVKEGEAEQEKTLPKESEKEHLKKDIKKDKFGTAPFEAEKKPKEAAKSTKSKSKNDKPKFVIESSLGKDFYASRKSNESVESRDSVHDDAMKSSFKPELSALVFENKVAGNPFALKQTEATSVEAAASLEEAQFVDIDLNPEPAIVKQRRELSRSVDDLDEKTVKCACGRGGNCSIM